MATTMDFANRLDRTAMETFGTGGMALLPWTKQILTVLWEHLRLLVQVIYYSFMSVFQMFRFEVHLRITDETGQHVQHMSTAANPTESFLFSSLFDGDNGVMVGGSNPLSNFCADVDTFPGSSTAEALLSSLRADNLCCGLVDDFVSRTSGKEDGIFLGHHPSWKMGFPGDWNIFVSSSDSSGTDSTCQKSAEKVLKQDFSEEERGCHWSSEEDQNVGEFDIEESNALWESLSKSSDPYNPFFFSACITTNTNMGKSKSEASHSSNADCISAGKVSEELLGPRGLNFWVSRSDSESSWGSSDGSCPDLDKDESERLWEFFSSSVDPYDPMCFTACTVSSAAPKTTKTTSSQQASLPAPCSKSDTDTEERESSFASSLSEDDEEEQLWKSLCQSDDPYHPLNFQACLQTSPTNTVPRSGANLDTLSVCPDQSQSVLGKKHEEEAAKPLKSRAPKPTLPERQFKHHCHPDTTQVPWKRPGQTSGSPPDQRKESQTGTTQKKVRFSPLVQVHVMRTWPFARQASRKGHWEEMARDRDRFRRRIQETEQAIGRCLSQSHRERVRAYLDSTLKSNPPLHSMNSE